MIDAWTMLQAAVGVLFGLIFVAGTLAISVLWEQRPGRLRFLPFFNTGDLGSFQGPIAATAASGPAVRAVAAEAVAAIAAAVVATARAEHEAIRALPAGLICKSRALWTPMPLPI